MPEIVRRSGWVPQRWRNGGGVTHELWRESLGDTVPERFAARLSVADVAQDGPFSRFPGVDRVILMLEGRGFRLRSGDRVVEIARPHAPFAFAGEDDWDCALIDGPVRDFNVMVDRGVYRAEVFAVDRRADLGARGFVLALADDVRVAGEILGRWDLWIGLGTVSVEGDALGIRLTAR